MNFLSKGRAANPRLYFIDLWLAGSLALKGDLDAARSAVAVSMKLRPEIKFGGQLARRSLSTPILGSPPSPRRHCTPAFAEPVSSTSNRRVHDQDCGCISKPAWRPAQRAASAGGKLRSKRLAPPCRPARKPRSALVSAVLSRPPSHGGPIVRNPSPSSGEMVWGRRRGNGTIVAVAN